MTQTSQYHFDRSKPFYPFIVNYIAGLQGIIQLSFRGLHHQIFSMSLEQKAKLMFELQQKTSRTEDENVILWMLITNTTDPVSNFLSPRSKQRGRSIKLDINEIAGELKGNLDYMMNHQTKMAGILLIACYEETRQTKDDKSPLWNFFYHVRNAAAHRGEFNITNVKRFPATWGSMEIMPALNHQPLFDSPGKTGLLQLGDPIALLWDIEQMSF